MKIILPLFVAGTLFTIVPSSAIAQSPTPKPLTTGTQVSPPIQAKPKVEIPPAIRTPAIDKALENLRLAIVRGIESGKLTTGEAHALSSKWERVQRNLKNAAGNDDIKPEERRRLREQTRDLAQDVYKETRDASVREAAQ